MSRHVRVILIYNHHKPIDLTSKIIFLNILISRSSEAHKMTKDSELNASKFFPNFTLFNFLMDKTFTWYCHSQIF
jgi:hypothetical protein